MDDLRLKVENIVTKEKIACFEQFFLFDTIFSKSCLLQRRQKASISEKGLTLSHIYICRLFVMSQQIKTFENMTNGEIVISPFTTIFSLYICILLLIFTEYDVCSKLPYVILNY